MAQRAVTSLLIYVRILFYSIVYCFKALDSAGLFLFLLSVSWNFALYVCLLSELFLSKNLCNFTWSNIVFRKSLVIIKCNKRDFKYYEQMNNACLII